MVVERTRARTFEGEGEGCSLMIDMGSKLRSWGSKGQGWVVESMY